MALNLGAFLRERFTIAPTSLYVFQRLLPVLVMVDLGLRWPLAETLLGSSGLLPHHPVDYWGLLKLSPSSGAVHFTFAATALVALSSLLGVWNRFSRCALFVGVASLHARNPWILDGGDECLRWLLLWSALVEFEAGEDALEVRGSGYVSGTWKGFSVAGAGLMLQPLIVYSSSVAHKLKGHSWRHGTAVEDALSQTLWQRPLGAWVVDTEPLSVVANYLTLGVEFGAPLLLVSPFLLERSRYAGILLLTFLQIGIATTLRMNLFPWVMTLSLIPFLPERFWLGLAVKRVPSARGRVSQGARWFSAALLVQSIVASADSVSGGRILPPRLVLLQTNLGIHQDWSMYSPNPYRYDFGIEILAETRDGRHATIDEGRAAHSFRPLERLWSDYRAGMYLENLANPRWPEELGYFSEWLARTHARAQSEPLSKISITLLEWKPREPKSVFRTHLYDWESEK